MTGDGALRQAAKREGVHVMGTLGVLDRLKEGNYIPVEEYKRCLEDLVRYNGGLVRLPSEELAKRIQALPINWRKVKGGHHWMRMAIFRASSSTGRFIMKLSI